MRTKADIHSRETALAFVAAFTKIIISEIAVLKRRVSTDLVTLRIAECSARSTSGFAMGPSTSLGLSTTSRQAFSRKRRVPATPESSHIAPSSSGPMNISYRRMASAP